MPFPFHGTAKHILAYTTPAESANQTDFVNQLSQRAFSRDRVTLSIRVAQNIAQ